MDTLTKAPITLPHPFRFRLPTDWVANEQKAFTLEDAITGSGGREGGCQLSGVLAGLISSFQAHCQLPGVLRALLSSRVGPRVNQENTTSYTPGVCL